MPRGVAARKKKASTKKLSSGLVKAQRERQKRIARAEELLDLITRRKGRIAEDFYDIGEALRELLKSRLYVDLGHESFAEMLEARGVLGETQAHKLIAVVSSFPRKQALEIGHEKAYVLTRLAAATSEPEAPATLLDSGKVIEGKAVAEASLRDLEDVRRKLNAKRRKKQPARELSPEAREMRALEGSLRAWFSRKAVRGVHVELIKQGGKWVARATLPLASAKKLVHAR
jgi:hypothetical protein